MKPKHIDSAVYCSAMLVATGVFLPLTSLPVIGDVSYNRIAEIESYIVVSLAISTPLLMLAEKARMILLTVTGIWLTLLFPAIERLMQSDGGGPLSKVMNKTHSAMQDFAADLFLHITDFSWGGYLLLIGLLSLTVSGLMRSFR